MLCTPPAFILSQDQTLEKIISQMPRHLKPSRAIYLSFTFCLSSILNKLWRDQYCTCNALYFSLVVQFSMTIRHPLPRTAWLFYHIPKALSSPFFDFFYFFSKNLFSRGFYPFFHSPFEVVEFYYTIICKHLSIVFLNYFANIIDKKKFLKKYWQNKNSCV